MNQSYHNIRSEYLHDSLDENSVSNDPFGQFDKWMNEALKARLPEANSMALATTGHNGQPSCRIVLLKIMNSDGFVFFSNYESHKGHQLAENPQSAITFFWEELERQIRIEGLVEKVNAAESEVYFHSRPFVSRLSAAISPQSQVVKNRQQLELAQDALREKHPDEKVPYPQNWGGYILKPHYFEFWQGRENRLHDRIIYTRQDNDWKIQRLAP